jgi:hypothetical protein
MAYKDFRDKALNDPAIHNWVKDVIKTLDEKDVVDALHGLEFLQKLFKWKQEEAWMDKKKREEEVLGIFGANQ